MKVTVNSNGTEVIITVKAENTLADFMSALAGTGISSEIKDGVFTIKESKYAYISDMDNTLAGELGLTATDSEYKKTDKVETKFNTNSNTLEDAITVTMTSGTTFGDLNVANGTNMVVKVKNNDGGEISITMTAKNTVGDFISALAGAGISSEITDGKLHIKGSYSAFISDMDNTLAGALALSTTDSEYSDIDYDGATINTNSDLQTYNKDLPINADTLMTGIAGISVGDTATITLPDGTTQPITVESGDTLSDFFSKIAQYGMSGAIDTDGKITIIGTGDTTISGDIITKIGASVTVNKDIITTNTNSNQQTHIIEVPMHDGTLLSELGITADGGQLKVIKDGEEHIITLQNTWTVADFRNALGNYGITSEVVDGKLSLTSDGVVKFEDISSNAVTIFGIQQEKWSSVGDFHQESDKLNDIRVDQPCADLKTQLEKLTDADGNVLKDSSDNALISGNIYVYQDGTRIF